MSSDTISAVPSYKALLDAIQGAAWVEDSHGAVTEANEQAREFWKAGSANGLPQIRIPIHSSATLAVAAENAVGPVLERLRIAEAKLELVLRAARAGFWEFRLDTEEATPDKRAREIFGIDETSGPLSFLAIAGRVHTADVGALWQSISDCLKAKTPNFEADCRMADGTGRAVWTSACGAVLDRTESGEARTLALLTRKAECCRDLDLLRRAFFIWPEPVLIVEGSEVAIANPAAAALFLASAEHELVGKEALDLIAPEDREYTRAAIKKVLLDGSPAERCRTQIRRWDGTEMEVGFSVFGFKESRLPAVCVIFEPVEDAGQWSSIVLPCE
jgi:PAS domain-containing protein